MGEALNYSFDFNSTTTKTLPCLVLMQQGQVFGSDQPSPASQLDTALTYERPVGQLLPRPVDMLSHLHQEHFQTFLVCLVIQALK